MIDQIWTYLTYSTTKDSPISWGGLALRLPTIFTRPPEGLGVTSFLHPPYEFYPPRSF